MQRGAVRLSPRHGARSAPVACSLLAAVLLAGMALGPGQALPARAAVAALQTGCSAGDGGVSGGSPSDPFRAQVDAQMKAMALGGQAGPEGSATLQGLLGDWYAQSVRPSLAAALADDAQLDDAIRAYFSWFKSFSFESAAPLQGKFSQQIAEGLDLSACGLQNALKLASQRCRDLNDPSQVGRISYWGAKAGLLGLGSRPGLDVASVQDRIQKCGSFTLDFVSRMDALSAPGTIEEAVHATFPLTLVSYGKNYGPDDPFDADVPWIFTGHGDLQFTNVAYPQVPKCTLAPSGAGSAFRVPLATIDFGQLAVDPVLMVIDPGSPPEKLTVTCEAAGGGTVTQTIPLHLWADSFQGFHAEEVTPNITDYSAGGTSGVEGASELPGRPAFKIRGWDAGGGAVFARKSYPQIKDLDRGRVSELTILELRHTPQP